MANEKNPNISYKVHFTELAFQETDPKDPMIPIGEPVIIKKGGDVPEWAQPAVLNALINAGMILPIARTEFEEPSLIPAVGNPELPPQFGGPATMAGLLAADEPAFTEPASVATGVGTPPQPTGTETPGVVPRPRTGDNKAMWEAYAESIGVDRAEAESLSKAALQERVAEREAQIEAGEQSPAERLV